MVILLKLFLLYMDITFIYTNAENKIQHCLIGVENPLNHNIYWYLELERLNTFSLKLKMSVSNYATHLSTCMFLRSRSTPVL